MNKKRIKSLAALLTVLICGLFVGLIYNNRISSQKKNSENENERLTRSNQTDSYRNKLSEYSLEKSQLSVKDSLKTTSSRYKRGVNQRLIYPKAEVIERNFVQGKMYSSPLFRAQKSTEGEPSIVGDRALGAIKINFTTAEVKKFLASDAEGFVMPLSADANAEILIQKHITRGPWTDSLIGSVKGAEESQVVMIVHDDAVAGSIAFYKEGDHYELGTSPSGQSIITQLDPDKFPETCGVINSADQSTSNSPHTQALNPNQTKPVELTEGTRILDSVYGYSKQAAVLEGGVAAMEAKILSSADLTNQVFANSQIQDVFYNIKATMADPDYVFPGERANDLSDEVNSLRSPYDEVLDAVSNLKVDLGADLMGFVVDETDGGANGIAGIGGNNMVMARTAMNSLTLSFPHELGHNLGCNHAWNDGSQERETNKRTYGWRFYANGRAYRTLMAYNPSFTRIPYFSSPDLTFEGQRIGAVDGYNATNDFSVDYALVFDYNTRARGYDGSNPQLGADNRFTVSSNLDEKAALAEPIYQFLIRRPGDRYIKENQNNYFITKGKKDQFQEVLTIENLTEGDVTNLSASITATNTGDFEISNLGATSLLVGESTTLTLTHKNNLSENVANLNLSHDAGNCDYSINSTPWYFVETFEDAARNVRNPFDFEPFIETDPNYYAWGYESGPTLSPNTGPNGPHEGNFYYYCRNYFRNGKEALLELDLDVSRTINPKLNFHYYRYGFSMGTLFIDVYDGNAWNYGVFSIDGQTQFNDSSPWIQATFDLKEYSDNPNIKIRFREKTLVGENLYAGDSAIDMIYVEATPAPTGYAAWTQSNNLLSEETSDTEASPAGDGIKNILKYAFNIDPNDNQQGGTQTITPSSGTSGLPLFEGLEENAASYRVEFVRRSNQSELEYEIVYSNDLENWSPVSGSVSTQRINKDWERVIVEDIPMQASEKRHFSSIKLKY